MPPLPVSFPVFALLGCHSPSMHEHVPFICRIIRIVIITSQKRVIILITFRFPTIPTSDSARVAPSLHAIVFLSTFSAFSPFSSAEVRKRGLVSSKRQDEPATYSTS
eukprot:FR743629.1.p2 GENE.FR743629.1~~FR743629.1.p2  ORF type:complete len:107 (-),score=1.26 FR743629.1:176-496(-)